MDRTGVRRRRGTAAALVLALAVLGPVARAAGHTTGPGAGAGRRYVIAAGDTLWSIARRAAPGRDPRPVVDQIERWNRLRPEHLVPGETILIPRFG